MPRIMASLILFFSIAAAAHAEVYTWIDSRGIAHFSDYPPGEIPHSLVQLQEPVTVPMAENLRQGRRISGIREEVNELLSSSERPEPGKSRQDRADAKLKKTCAGYRRKLDHIQSRLRAGYSNDRGNMLRRQRRTLSQKLSRECILG